MPDPLGPEPAPAGPPGPDKRRAERVGPGRLVRCRVRTGGGEARGATVLDVSALGPACCWAARSGRGRR